MLWMNASGTLDFTVAEPLVSQILGRDPADEMVRRCTARLYDVQGREAEALVHWQFLRDADAGDFEAAFHLARARMQDSGAAAEMAAAWAAPEADATFHAALAAALIEPAPLLAGEFRHIAICGVSFCGSTLVDRVLGGLPGVKSIGESHWLAKAHFDGAYRNARMSDPIEDIRFVPCTVCGHRCDVLTRPFRRSLAADSANWYRKVALRLDTRTLISADKNLRILIEKDPLLDLSALVIFKSPLQAWASKLDKLPKDREPAYYDKECSQYITVWTRAYRAFLDHFRPRGPVVFLNFDAFTRTPEPLLRAVLARLDLPFDAGVLSRTEPGHAIGGNSGSMRKLRDLDYEVRILPLKDPVLDPAHVAMIAADEDMQTTWREMMLLHETLLQA